MLQGILVGILETANSIYKRYRNVFMSSGLSKELEYSQQFVEPLLNTLQFITEQVSLADYEDHHDPNFLGKIR